MQDWPTQWHCRHHTSPAPRIFLLPSRKQHQGSTANQQLLPPPSPHLPVPAGEGCLAPGHLLTPANVLKAQEPWDCSLWVRDKSQKRKYKCFAERFYSGTSHCSSQRCLLSVPASILTSKRQASPLRPCCFIQGPRASRVGACALDVQLWHSNALNEQGC